MDTDVLVQQLQDADDRELRELLATTVADLAQDHARLRDRVAQLEAVLRAISGAAGTVTGESDR